MAMRISVALAHLEKKAGIISALKIDLPPVFVRGIYQSLGNSACAPLRGSPPLLIIESKRRAFSSG